MSHEEGLLMTLLIIIVFAGIAVWEISRLKQAKRKREIVFFCIAWPTGFVLLMMMNAGVEFPCVVGSIINLLKAIGLHYQ